MCEARSILSWQVVHCSGDWLPQTLRRRGLNAVAICRRRTGSRRENFRGAPRRGSSGASRAAAAGAAIRRAPGWGKSPEKVPIQSGFCAIVLLFLRVIAAEVFPHLAAESPPPGAHPAGCQRNCPQDTQNPAHDIVCSRGTRVSIGLRTGPRTGTTQQAPGAPYARRGSPRLLGRIVSGGCLDPRRAA